MVSQVEENITEAEIAVYDRQIRLWGLDAQNRLRNASVLVVGMNGLGAEIAKNLVLAGIKCLTMMDDQLVSDEDFYSQFLIPRECIGDNRASASKSRCQELNPMVTIETVQGTIQTVTTEFLERFNVVCLINQSSETCLSVNKLCRQLGVKFSCGAVFGALGYFFQDLISHEFSEEVTVPTQTGLDGGQNGVASSTEETGESSGEPLTKKAKNGPISAAASTANGDSATNGNIPGEQPTAGAIEKVVKDSKYEFCSLQEAMNLEWISKLSARRLKRQPLSFFVIQALLAYNAKHNRFPAAQSRQDDQEDLKRALADIFMEQKMSAHSLSFPDNFVDYCLGHMGPVCAIVGGVWGQEIIKAVSKKDRPLNNYFVFNGLCDSTGTEMKLPITVE